MVQKLEGRYAKKRGFWEKSGINQSILVSVVIVQGCGLWLCKGLCVIEKLIIRNNSGFGCRMVSVIVLLRVNRHRC